MEADLDPSGDTDYSAISPAQASEELAEMLISMKLRNIISAKQCCVLAFFASKAGAIGTAAELALPPSRHTSRFSAKFDQVVSEGPRDQDCYMLPMGRTLACEASRIWSDLPVLPPHEALLEELLSSSTATDGLDRALRAGELPPKYFTHPVKASAPAGTTVCPVSLYLDGVQYRGKDWLMGVFIYFSILRADTWLQC